MKNLLYILLFVPFALFGQENYSLSFDGSSYVDVSINNPDYSNGLSILFWAEFPETSLQTYIIDQYNQIGITYINEELLICFQTDNNPIGDLTCSSVSLSSDSHWVSLVFEQSTSLFTIYIDDSLEVESIFTGSVLTNNTYPLTFGASSNAPNTNFNNTIDNISIWDKSLSQQEIQSYISCPPTGNEEGLVGYWNFNEGSGNTVYDLSGNGNHGTVYGATFSEDVPEETCSILDQLNQSFDAWNISIDLSAGWNMFGYGCPSTIDVSEGLSNHTESIAIVKDNNGSVYMPEFGFNGIGDFTPGYGYQIKVTEPIEGFSLCDWYVNDIPEDNIVSLQEENAFLIDSIDILNTTPLYQVGDIAEGGIIFYVDETSERGLVLAEENIEGVYEWGCQGYSIFDTSTNSGLFCGLNNSQAIYNNCSSENIAAKVCLNYSLNDYQDWYLPSRDELYLMYLTVGKGGLDINNNLGGFDTNYSYWSSSELNLDGAWMIEFHTGGGYPLNKNNLAFIRPIRAFGNWTMGCMAETACNYNSEATMADGSCEYAELGYDCDDNITEYVVGMEAEGGIVFYVDESGEFGLVAAMEDLTEGATNPNGWGYNGYEWGCFQNTVQGADGMAIGTGYQNTMDIVNQGCTSENDGITAAQAALNTEISDYSDWYLPSRDELVEMYNTIVNGVFDDIVNFEIEPDWYWSSSESNLNYSVIVAFDYGDVDTNVKQYTFRARAIRAFGNWTMGCMDEAACNYNTEANMSDSSCTYPEQGYDCDGNITAEIGDVLEGGYLFYIDETGQNGLVAAMEDIGQMEWGCYGTGISGADGQAIGTGYQNTFDIVAGCTEIPIAASEVLAYESGGYTDWFLPSEDELKLMYNNIGNGSSLGNIGDFFNGYYWSSTQYGNGSGFDLDFTNGIGCDNCEDNDYENKSRPIRAFGNWTMGCMDSLACNYNPEANMADGSCMFAEQGYDCDGNITAQIGDEFQGGIVFYVDESGESGLVAALEDLTEGATDPYGLGYNGYEWACKQEYADGADGSFIGTGYQNTMDIVNQGCATEYGGITAAQASLDYENGGYTDWYLPSIDELHEMYNTIGPGGPEGNIGGFSDNWYWSSSEGSDSAAWGVENFISCGCINLATKNSPFKVRVISSF